MELAAQESGARLHHTTPVINKASGFSGPLVAPPLTLLPLSLSASSLLLSPLTFIFRYSYAGSLHILRPAKELLPSVSANMAERYIPDHRKTQFKAKNTFKPEELRRRREEQQVEIRKAKREENLAKRRGITGRDGTQTAAPGASLGASIDSDDEGGTIESQVCNELFLT